VTLLARSRPLRTEPRSTRSIAGPRTRDDRCPKQKTTAEVAVVVSKAEIAAERHGRRPRNREDADDEQDDRPDDDVADSRKALHVQAEERIAISTDSTASSSTHGLTSVDWPGAEEMVCRVDTSDEGRCEAVQQTRRHDRSGQCQASLSSSSRPYLSGGGKAGPPTVLAAPGRSATH